MSTAVRGVWSVMTVICSLSAFAFVFLDDSSTAFAVALAGLVFFLMSNANHDDLDS